MFNIMRAQPTETVDEILIKLEGTEENLKNGLQSLSQEGIEVEFLEVKNNEQQNHHIVSL